MGMLPETGLRRIITELDDMQNNPYQNSSAAPINGNLFRWHATVNGPPPDSVYTGGVFHLVIDLSNSYPIRPPRVTFCTKIYHPRVNREGEIDPSILYDNWSLFCGIKTVLNEIRKMLRNPKPPDRLDNEIARMYRESKHDFNAVATSWTRRYARHY